MMNSITTRLIVLLTGCAALIVGAGMLLDYRLSKIEILEGLEDKSTDEVQVVVGDLENWLNGVEGATRFLGTILEQREYSREGLRQMLRDIVVNNGEIFGAAIALNPGSMDDTMGFAPYYFRRDGGIHYADLASIEANYQKQDWYTQPVTKGGAVWVEPYFDAGGGEVNMTTFSVPVYRTDDAGQRTLYGVVTADVKLRNLQQVLEQLHLGENSYSLLFSRQGILMSTRTQRSVMKHYSRMNSRGVDMGRWPGLFKRALAGEVVSSEIDCPEREGRCTMRLGSLRSTGWPIAVVYDQREILAPLHIYQLKTGIISAATLLLMALAVYLVTSRQTRPLKDLSRATENIAKGVMDTPLPKPRGNDEVARLVRSFSSMNRDLKTYIADLETATANRSRLEGELAAAREIQMSMLPGSGEALVHEGGVDLWARVEPAKTVGGDLYTYYRAGDLLFIAVGDVSDKGVPAALFMARAISLIQQLSGTATPPDQAMAALNNALERDNHACMFVTLFLGVLDIPSGRLRFASGGHTAPSLLRGSEVSVVEQDMGPALGLARDQQYPDHTIQLEAGDRLAIFTDGIDEAFNEENEMYGVDRFNLELLASRDLPVEAAGDCLFSAVERHRGERPQSDDITLLLLQYSCEQPTSARRSFHLGPGLTGRVQGWIETVLERWKISGTTAMEMNLVAEEMVTNVQKYGGLDATDEVSLELLCNNAVLSLEVRDAGRAFDPLNDSNRSELGADIDSAEIGGLGVHLIAQLTERQSYRREDNHNILRIEKELPGQGE